MEGVWIAPVGAQVMITLRCEVMVAPVVENPLVQKSVIRRIEAPVHRECPTR